MFRIGLYHPGVFYCHVHRALRRSGTRCRGERRYTCIVGLILQRGRVQTKSVFILTVHFFRLIQLHVPSNLPGRYGTAAAPFSYSRLAIVLPNCICRVDYLGAGDPTRQADLGKLARASRDPTSRCSATALYNDKQPRLRPTSDQVSAEQINNVSRKQTAQKTGPASTEARHSLSSQRHSTVRWALLVRDSIVRLARPETHLRPLFSCS